LHSVPDKTAVAASVERKYAIRVNELGHLYSTHVVWKALVEQLISATSERSVFVA
jgi:hypothetical protein